MEKRNIQQILPDANCDYSICVKNCVLELLLMPNEIFDADFDITVNSFFNNNDHLSIERQNSVKFYFTLEKYGNYAYDIILFVTNRPAYKFSVPTYVFNLLTALESLETSQSYEFERAIQIVKSNEKAQTNFNNITLDDFEKLASIERAGYKFGQLMYDLYGYENYVIYVNRTDFDNNAYIRYFCHKFVDEKLNAVFVSNSNYNENMRGNVLSRAILFRTLSTVIREKVISIGQKINVFFISKLSRDERQLWNIFDCNVLNLRACLGLMSSNLLCDYPIKQFIASHENVNVVACLSPFSVRYLKATDAQLFEKSDDRLKKWILPQNSDGYSINLKQITNNQTLDPPLPAEYEKYSKQQLIDLLTSPTVIDADPPYLKDMTTSVATIINGFRQTLPPPPGGLKQKVYIFGDCKTYGICAEDKDTVASQLQNLINGNALLIKVENRGIIESGGRILYSYDIANSIEYNDGDIVIFMGRSVKNIEGVYKLDITKLFLPPNDVDMFFDHSHWTPKGMNAIAAELFKFLQENKLLYPNVNIPKYPDIDKYKKLLNNNDRRVSDFQKYKFQLELDEFKNSLSAYRPQIGSIVMNCNPFTLGHRYLIEYAASKVEKLFIFVVEEDKSIFPFSDRIELVRKGTEDLSNIVVLPSGNFIISQLTFTDYFGKSELQDKKIDPSMDVEIFGQHIAPTLGITVRFAGEEPIDNVTRQYNEAMARILPKYGVKFEVIPRKKVKGGVISASRVRKLLEAKDWKSIAQLVPITTLDYLKEKYGGEE
jgi:[citrate (pro-3S)-lyase] ligase